MTRNLACVVRVAGIVSFLLLALGANAALVTFDTVTPPVHVPYLGFYTENGVRLTSYSQDSFITDWLYVLGSSGIYFDSVYGYNEYIEFSMDDGSTFDLVSFVLATNGNYGNSNARWLETSAGALDYWTFLPFSTATATPLNFSGSLYSDLTWFRVSTVYFATELDDVVVNSHSEAVPEPGSLSLAVLAVLALLSLRKAAVRRRRS